MFTRNLYTILGKGLLVAGCVVTLSACGGGGGFGQDYDSPFVPPTPTPEPTPGPEPTPVPAPTDNNILPNSEFEEGEGDEFTGWTKINSAATLTAITTDTCAGRGLQAVSTSEGQQYTVQIESPEFPTIVGTEEEPNSYTASMWIKGDVDGGVVRISTGGAGSPQYGNDTTIGTDWQQVVYTFEANGDTTTLRLDLGKSVASYVIDDVKVVPGSTPDPSSCPHGSGNSGGASNLAANGGAELSDSDPAPWAGVGAATVAVDSSTANSGNNSVLVAGRTATWNGASYSLLDVVEPNSTYNLSVQVRLASPSSADLKVSSKMTKAGEDTYPGVTDAVAVSDSGWTELSGTFTTADLTGVTTFYVYVESSTADASYYIDDLVVTKSE